MEALRRYAAESSGKKQQAVREAIQSIIESNSVVTVSAVARAAGVSREFVHSHQHLRDAVREAEPRSRKAIRNASAPTADPHASAGLRADRATFLSQIQRQKEIIREHQQRIADLEKQRKRWLGAQLEATEAIDPVVHSELRVTNERLMANNTALTRQVQELRRLVAALEADLAASREAHQETVATFTAPDARAVALRPLAVRGALRKDSAE